MPPGFPDDATLRKLHHDLLGFFRRRLPPDRDPQDYVAEVLIALRNYRGRASLSTFAYAVARNMLADVYRRPRTERLFAIEDPATGPSTQLRRHQAVCILRAEIAALNPPYAQAVLLRLEGLEHQEIAERLGISPHTVRSRLARGLAELRERFAGRRKSIEL